MVHGILKLLLTCVKLLEGVLRGCSVLQSSGTVLVDLTWPPSRIIIWTPSLDQSREQSEQGAGRAQKA